MKDDLSNSDITLDANQTYGGYQNILLSDIYNGKFTTESVTIGQAYEDSWIGKKIEYTSSNGITDYVGSTGTIGSNSVSVNGVRSITLDDINNAVGFTETINSVTISNSNGGFAYPNAAGTGWIEKTDEDYSSYQFPKDGYYYYYSDYDDAFLFYSATTSYNGAEITVENPNKWKFIYADCSAYWIASRGVRVIFRIPVYESHQKTSL